jgi:hypothetical protein
MEDKAGASKCAVRARLLLHSRHYGLRLCQHLNSIADFVRITDKAFIKLLLANLIIKLDDGLSANAIGTRCRLQPGDAVLLFTALACKGLCGELLKAGCWQSHPILVS